MTDLTPNGPEKPSQEEPEGVPVPPNVQLGLELGLGPGFQPVPFGCELIPIQSDDGEQAYVLRLMTPVGMIGVMMGQDEARMFRDHVNERVSGLHLPPRATSPLIPPGASAPIRRPVAPTKRTNG